MEGKVPTYVGDEKEKSAQVNVSAAYDATAKEASLEGVGRPEFTAAEEKAVLRKIDMYMMPLMCVTVLLQFLDKTSLNYANLLGVQTSLKLVGQEYSWLGSVFYFGYLFASPIHGFLLQKLPLARYTSGLVFVWGAVLACHAACKSYAGLVAVRLILGILEGGITPAFILLTGRFYTRAEQVNRTGIWFLQNGTAQIVGGLISYALLQKPLNVDAAVPLWAEMFLILGAITMFFGIVLALFMPESPSITKMLTPEQRLIAVERIRESRPGNNSKKFEMYQLVEALKDVRLYLFALGVCAANIANGGVSNFGSAIISSFGYDKPKTALLGMTTGGSEIFAVLLGLLLAKYTGTRVVPGVFSFVVAIIGSIMILTIPTAMSTARMAGYALVFFYPVASPFYYSWLSSAIGGTTKKVVFNVSLQLAYCGNIIGPQTYQAAAAPGYVPAKITLIVMFVVSSFAMIGISLVHLRDNRARDKASEFGADDTVDIEFSDKTDKEVLSFRYPY